MLNSLARDADLTHSKWKTGHLAVDTFQKVMDSVREKQLEALRLLAELTKDPVGRWDKMMGE